MGKIYYYDYYIYPPGSGKEQYFIAELDKASFMTYKLTGDYNHIVIKNIKKCNIKDHRKFKESYVFDNSMNELTPQTHELWEKAKRLLIGEPNFVSEFK